MYDIVVEITFENTFGMSLIQKEAAKDIEYC
jgi:hypothetical protein